jgi:hypothetical protein
VSEERSIDQELSEELTEFLTMQKKRRGQAMPRSVEEHKQMLAQLWQGRPTEDEPDASDDSADRC